jgi:hypothetical protein
LDLSSGKPCQFGGAVFLSLFLRIALLIIGIEIITIGVTGRRMAMMPGGMER